MCVGKKQRAIPFPDVDYDYNEFVMSCLLLKLKNKCAFVMTYF